MTILRSRVSKKIVTWCTHLLPWLFYGVALWADTTDVASDSVVDSGLIPSDSGLTADAIFAHLDGSLNKVYPMLIGLAYTLGVLLILKSMLMFKKHGYKTAFMSASSSLLGPFAVLLIGVMLIYTPSVLDIFFMTIYGSSEVQNTMTWASAASTDAWYAALVPMIGLIQVIGLCAFIRGWTLLLRATGEGQSTPGSVGKGVMHIIGGVMAVNITGTIDLINQSLGLS